jgi:TPR repeat protein
MYTTGEGVTKDLARGVKYMENACLGGLAISCNDIAVFYVQGVGVPRDDEKAATYFKAACSGGDNSGCKNAKLLSDCKNGLPSACAAFGNVKIVPP